MRILFVSPAFPPFTGGGERYARSLALALAARQHEICVVTTLAEKEADFWKGTGEPEHPQKAADGPLEIWRCPLRPFPGGRSGLLAWRKAMVLVSMLPGDQSSLLFRMAGAIPPIGALNETLEAAGSDAHLVHAFNISWEAALSAGWRFAQRAQRPYVLTPFAHLGEGAKGRVAWNSMMDHQRRILNAADAVLTLTTVEQEGFRHWGVTPRIVRTVGGGLDEMAGLSPERSLLTKLGMQQPFVIFIGRLSFDKGAIHAAKAVLALREEGSTVVLALVGTLTSEFSRFYRRLSPAEKESIRPLGNVSDADKHALLREAVALLLPSRIDSLGIVLLEAWSHGTPVIGADAGGIRAVIDDEEDGLLVPFGDVTALAVATRRLLEDEEKRRKLGETGRLKVRKRYTWSQVSASVGAVYEQILQGSTQ